MEYSALNNGNINGAVRVHLENLKEGIVFELGEELAALFYKEVIKDLNSWGFVAIVDGTVVGVSVCTLNLQGLSRRFYKRNTISIIKSVATRTTHNPRLCKHLVDAFLHKIEDAPTLLFFMVDAKHQSQGIGSRLFEKVVESFKEKKVERFTVEFNEDNNVNNFYEIKGFTYKSSYRIYGKKRLVYEYKL